MALSTTYPRLADPSDIPRLLSGVRVHHEWPPPGTTEIVLATPSRWVAISGQPSTGRDGDWWVTDLARIALDVDSDVTQLLSALGRTFTGPIASFVSVAGQWPVIFEQGKGDVMRWLASTVRGTLAGVEQFQFGINWGSPGSDPDYDEGECLAFSEDLADAIQSALATSNPSVGIAPLAVFPSAVKFTEVGSVTKTQTTATGSDGTGGNLEQAFETQWYAYPTGSQPTGSASSVSLPFEVAQALTLQTDHRGPSGRGRLYMPPYGVGYMGSDGRFTTATGQIIGKFLGDVFDAMTASSSLVPVIVSRRRIILNEVKEILVGSVPDSQRRRRRSQDEARVSRWTA